MNSLDVHLLETRLIDAVGWARVIAHNSHAATIALPSLRYAHDQVHVFVEMGTDGGFQLSDLGELAGLVEDAEEIAALLECAGAEHEFIDGTLLRHIGSEQDLLPEQIIAFARNLSAASIIDNVRTCILESVAAAPPDRERATAVGRMAAHTRNRIIEELPGVAPLLRLKQRVPGRGGVFPIIPLTVQTPTSTVPRLATTFIDLTASPTSVAAAERDAAFIGAALSAMPIPKFVVIRGTAGQIEDLAHLYDQGDTAMTAIADDDIEALITEVREQVPEFT